MTRSELQELIETELADLIENGLDPIYVHPMLTNDGEYFPGFDPENFQPSTHELVCERPFVFDIRQLPETFYGFKLSACVIWNQRPKEFQSNNQPDPFGQDAKNYKPYEDPFMPEKVMAYARAHAQEIREQLNDDTFTIKNISDMIVWRDFDLHKKQYRERELRRVRN